MKTLHSFSNQNASAICRGGAGGPNIRVGIAMIVLAAMMSPSSPSRAAVPTSPATPVDFNRDIRPILSQNCFFCHGPDENERKGGLKESGGLRLDTATGQRQDLGGYFAVVPGKPETSDLLRRITTSDADDVMPPAASGKRVTPDQADLLRRWIAEGARFSGHWSYERPVRPTLPDVRDAAWPRNPIDRFLLARLEQEGLRPRPEADRPTLARRLAFDLTGLPPSVEEVDTFVHDPSPAAYENYVDAQLAKAAYGEHWARLWLDLARYADSAGYADDPPRTIWPYRDYVIRAFAENMPFDQFTIEQLAGDLLPNPTEEQLKATAFHRNTMTNSEGGTSDEEFRNVAIVDRVNTTFAVWMGTSMACAQCHSHKYDPISQKEYFQLFAFFNNTADADRPDEAPLLPFENREIRERRARVDQELAALEAEIRSEAPNLTEAATYWSRLFPWRLDWQTPRPESVLSDTGAQFQRLDDHSIRVTTPGTNAAKETVTIDLPFDTETRLSALRLEALADPSLPSGGPGVNGGFLVRQVRAKILPVPNQPGPSMRYLRIELPRKGSLRLSEVEAFSNGHNIARSRSASASSVEEATQPNFAIDGATQGPPFAATLIQDNPWWELDFGGEYPVERLVLWFDPQSFDRLDGFRVTALDASRKKVWEKNGNPPPKKEVAFDLIEPRDVEFANASADRADSPFDEALVATDAPQSARYRRRGERGWSVDGTLGQDHTLLIALPRPITLERGATLRVTVSQQSDTKSAALGRFRLGVASDARAVEHIDTPPEIRAAVAVAPDLRGAHQNERIREYFARHVAPGLAVERDRLTRLARERDEIKPLTVPVAKELQGKDRRTTKIQLRGNFLTTTDEVTAGVPSVWPAIPSEVPQDRLALARWLISGENPLTARVIANRYWEQIFGHGIVRTTEEFGSQGDLPVNQPLLDWLACELQDQHWDLKHFLKLLVTSAAYRQSSKVTPEAQERDPDNRWLSRGPRFRLSAEMIRDQALAASGLLSPRMYGPSVRPPRPSLDLRAAFGGNLDWQTSPGEDRYRRGLYTEWRRTSPYPSMATFDAPSREVCTLRRNRSNTPLQALVTLNDPVYIEAARGLARRMIDAASLPGERIQHGYRRVLARTATPTEVAEMAALAADLQSTFERQPWRAVALADLESRDDAPAAEAVELASWTAVANVLLNLDETLMKR
ncbi:MAG: PSD1 domain-containing protein [Verrucomicrobiales bacterium]|nr:PSD1 domain-containing protein [Verrucomicrobiales bacterium]